MELAVNLTGPAGGSLYRRLYNELRDALLAGRLRPGERLPSTRELATQLEVSRNTVILAYEQLLSEGYLEGKQGSGTYVAVQFPTAGVRKTSTVPTLGGQISFSAALQDLDQWVYSPPNKSVPYDFRPGVPMLEHFPLTAWRRITSRHLRRLSPDLARYGDPAGHRPLREAVASYLARSRAVACDADQIVITTGSQQALDLLLRLLISPGERVVIEEPYYPAAVAAFRLGQAKLHAVAVDDQGIRTDHLPGNARLIYVTPSHQFPTGVLLPVSRRLELLHWATKYGTVVVEDDYDCEFRYGGRPVESLQGMDSSGLVIYLGTFSKVLFPPLRLGYIVLPPSLVQPFSALKWIADRHTAGLDQHILADFIREGHFERYLRRMRWVYQERRETLLESLHRYVGGYIRVAPSVAGLHLTGWLRVQVDTAPLAASAAQLGVGIYPLTPYYLRKERPGLLFGYSAMTPRQIREGIHRLGNCLRGLIG